MPSLPITAIFDRLRESIRQHRGVVLQAPPGAGKTTGVPLALLDEPWLQAKRIIMLEPRRLAARAAAFRMAELLGEPVGATVGYRIRMESRVGLETRIEVVTEGVLIRMLQTDPGLSGTGLVVFDEFHERSLAADLGLALCRDIQEGYNETLRLIVMSATIETTPVAGLLGQAPILTCPGQSFPVETHYRDCKAQEPLAAAVAASVMQAISEDQAACSFFCPVRRRSVRRPNAWMRCTSIRAGRLLPYTAICRLRYRSAPFDRRRPAVARSCWPLPLPRPV